MTRRFRFNKRNSTDETEVSEVVRIDLSRVDSDHLDSSEFSEGYVCRR